MITQVQYKFLKRLKNTLKMELLQIIIFKKWSFVIMNKCIALLSYGISQKTTSSTYYMVSIKLN